MAVDLQPVLLALVSGAITGLLPISFHSLLTNSGDKAISNGEFR